jgi:phage shock protein A
MSTFDRMRAALAGTVAEIEEARRAATAELIAYRAGEKLMAARAAELADEAAGWQRRAEEAVRAGDDDLAREALARRGWVVAEIGQLRADRDEAARSAAELLRGRRDLDAALARLKLREGTVAAGLAAARTGSTPLATEGKVWDRFDEAERRIEEEAIVGELAQGEIDEVDLARQGVADLEKKVRADRALTELKRRMKPPR